jgi:chromosome segregation ATPase
MTIRVQVARLAEQVAALRDIMSEYDRRYAEVDVEREKALKIKEQADRAALELAREIQTYKDEKANELRSQIERERGTYASQGDLRGAVEKLEAQLKPIADYVAIAQGRSSGLSTSWSILIAVISAAVAIAAIVLG